MNHFTELLIEQYTVNEEKTYEVAVIVEDTAREEVKEIIDKS